MIAWHWERSYALWGRCLGLVVAQMFWWSLTWSVPLCQTTNGVSTAVKHKVIFVLGGPGSGKGTQVRKTRGWRIACVCVCGWVRVVVMDCS